MNDMPVFQVVLLPSCEVAAQVGTLTEALAWARGYNEVMEDDARRAIVTIEPGQRTAARRCA